jgi:membrane protease YdiL (CAAX protease family)
MLRTRLASQRARQGAFFLTIAISFFEVSLSVILENKLNGFLGHAFLKLLSYSPVLIYIFIKNEDKLRWQTSVAGISSTFFFKSALVLTLMFIISRILIEVEILILDGIVVYLKDIDQNLSVASYIVNYPLTHLIVGPIVEEFFFRGLILKKLRLVVRNHALWFSSFLFTLPHLRVDLIFSSFFCSFTLGYVLGWVMLKNNNIVHVIILHSLWNFLNFLLPFILNIISN